MTRLTTHAPATDPRFPVPLRGIDIDAETRRAHWDDQVDVIALRFACCDAYYPGVSCHEAATDHDPVGWPRDRLSLAGGLCHVVEYGPAVKCSASVASGASEVPARATSDASEQDRLPEPGWSNSRGLSCCPRCILLL